MEHFFIKLGRSVQYLGPLNVSAFRRRSSDRFDTDLNGDGPTDDTAGRESHRSSIGSAEVRLQLAEAAGHLTVSDGSGRAPFACDVGPHLKRTLQERDVHGNISSVKHGYKLPVVPNVKHNVTEKVAQVWPLVCSHVNLPRCLCDRVGHTLIVSIDATTRDKISFLFTFFISSWRRPFTRTAATSSPRRRGRTPRTGSAWRRGQSARRSWILHGGDRVGSSGCCRAG